MENFRISIIQTDLHWQDISANLAMLEEKIWHLQGKTDLILLPEMFNTGFTMDAKNYSEPINYNTFKWMRQMAAQIGAIFCGSFIVKDEGAYFNRLHWVEPEGDFSFYNKRHLFRMGNEHIAYAPGKNKLIRNRHGWNILPLVCYDLRFPVWSRNRYNAARGLDYDVLIYVANWPASRTEVWETLLKARAMENQCFCIGINRTGSDGMGVDYAGRSMAVNYKGQVLNKVSGEQSIETISLNLPELQKFRDSFPAYLDADEFELH